MALDRGERSSSHRGHFTLEEKAPDVNWIGGCVGPRAGLGVEAKKHL